MANNATMFAGLQTDLYRSTYFDAISADPSRLPKHDQAELEFDEQFGSAHVDGFHMSSCDGSTQFIPYDVDGRTFSRHGNRADGDSSSE